MRVLSLCESWAQKPRFLNPYSESSPTLECVLLCRHDSARRVVEDPFVVPCPFHGRFVGHDSWRADRECSRDRTEGRTKNRRRCGAAELSRGDRGKEAPDELKRELGDWVGDLSRQLQMLGVDTLVPTSTVKALLGVTNMTLFRWRQKGLMPEPPITNPNRYPLSWLFDLMAAQAVGGTSTVARGAALVLRLAKADGIRKQTLARLCNLGMPVLMALESGDLEPSAEHLLALHRGLGLTLIDLYRMGRIATALHGLREAG